MALPPEIEKLFEELGGGKVKVSLVDAEDKPKGSGRPKAIQADVLRGLLSEIRKPCPFKIGDIVEQRIKGRHAFYRYPADGDVAIVIGYLEPNTKAQSESGRPLTWDDMVILTPVSHESGREAHVMHAVESWRFQKVEDDGDVE